MYVHFRFKFILFVNFRKVNKPTADFVTIEVSQSVQLKTERHSVSIGLQLWRPAMGDAGTKLWKRPYSRRSLPPDDDDNDDEFVQ